MNTLNKVVLSKNALLHNFFLLHNLDNSKHIFLNLKSNAYGHGIEEITLLLKELKQTTLVVVNSIEEAQLVSKLNIKQEVLVTGYVLPSNLINITSNIKFAVWSIKQCKEILGKLPKSKLHLFIDSGMNREGIKFEELKNDIVKYNQYIPNIEGILSHFSSADEPNSLENAKQIETYNICTKYLENNGFKFKYKHLSASSGHIRGLTKIICNSSRIGLSLYGINPLTNSKLKLTPVLSLYSTLIQVKDVMKGEKIGYNATYTVSHNMTIGILPIGYADGIPRELSNIGYVKYKNKFCKYVGRISMNLCAIDISEIKNPKVGDSICIISNNTKNLNSVTNISNLTKKIPYQILIGINSNIIRLIKRSLT
jgi:alanine racemase